jgi:hypothetical protein
MAFLWRPLHVLSSASLSLALLARHELPLGDWVERGQDDAVSCAFRLLRPKNGNNDHVRDAVRYLGLTADL